MSNESTRMVLQLCDDGAECGKSVSGKEGSCFAGFQVCSYEDEVSCRYEGGLLLVDANSQIGKEIAQRPDGEEEAIAGWRQQEPVAQVWV